MKKLNYFKKLFTFIFIFSIILFSCKRDCVCTKVECLCPELTMYIEANVDNSEEGSYTQQEINNFYIVRTNKQFEPIDSISLVFGKIAGNIDYNSVYLLKEKTFSNFDNFKSYNFIIKNRLLNSKVSISGIEYSEKMKRMLCNECSNCEDEYIICPQYSNYKLNFNYKIQNNFNIRLIK